MNIIDPHAKNEYFGFSFCLPKRIFPNLEKAINNDKRKIPIWMKVRASFPELTFWVSDGVNEVVVQKDICEEARNQGVTKEQIIKQFMRVGDTPFEVKNIDVVIDGELFIPVSLMNMVRREGIEVLQERRMNRHED